MQSRLTQALVTGILVGGSLLAAPAAASAAAVGGVQIQAEPSNCEDSLTSTSYSMKCRSHINIGSYYVDGTCVRGSSQEYVQGPVRTDGVWPFWGKPSSISCRSGWTLASANWHYFD